MFKVFAVIGQLNAAAQAGAALENASTWANRGQLVSAVTVVLSFLALVLGYFGVLPEGSVSDEDVKTVALGVAGVAGVFTHVG